MFAQLVSLVALSVLFTPVPTLAVPGPAWIRRQQDAQSSLTLDPAVISHGLEQDGQGDNPDPGQVRSLTSSNNFINFCLPFLDQGVVLTNGAQVTAGSCNQVPMGRIISLDLAPRCKFVFPKNGDESLVENTPFTVQMKILNMETGNFVNAQTNYYAAPQQVNDQGIVIGHSHIVIEALPSLTTTEPLDPNKFAFFKGLNDPVDGNNILSTAVTAGLPAGIYRMCSINTAANHQPALVSNAQHGALDDCSYFTVKAAGANATASATDSAAATATDSATATNAATDAAATTAASTDAAQATDAATDSATDAATATDSATDAAATDAPAATDSATDVPAATDSATDAGNNDANASTDAPAATTDSAAPAATDSAATPDNGNNGNGGDNSNNNNGGGNNDNNNNGGNNDNSGNNGGNTDNSGNNGGDNANNGGNGGNNDNNNNNGGDATNTDNNGGNAANTDNSGDSSAAPAATETPAADNNATPSQDAPTDSPSAAPEATPAQGNGDNSNAGASDNQGGNGGDNGAASTA